MTRQSDIEQREVYTIGYSPARIEGFTRRTATGEGEGEAGFFSRHLSTGKNVLDCGCGPGSITIGFAEIVTPGDVLGLDIERSQIESASELATERGATNVRFETASIYQVPSSDDYFDAAYIQFVLEFLRDPVDALKEVHRILKPGGVIGVKSADWGSQVIAPHDAAMDEAWDLSLKLWRHNGGDPFLGRRLPELLRKAGFARIEVNADIGSTPKRSETTGRMGAGFAGMFAEPYVADQLIRLGLVDEQSLEKLRSALTEWTAHPDAFRAYLSCRALAWKE